MDVSFALGRRSKCRRWRVESTMAMFIGTLISRALAVQAAEMSFAAVRVSWGEWEIKGGDFVEDILWVGVVFYW